MALQALDAFWASREYFTIAALLSDSRLARERAANKIRCQPLE
eukprot:CAMPEP_0179275928 /NCGR_PEP_ID=MMETSP0797-20121207/34316_1 /TAXON_ID=47934 /ORGANISM="Dinophysis acuminata, Strain DAEP01" /LENGTH=42 /DNA_ID= /DNA_START= /DNA_END= /DNA_ORIENTATION=